MNAGLGGGSSGPRQVTSMRMLFPALAAPSLHRPSRPPSAASRRVVTQEGRLSPRSLRLATDSHAPTLPGPVAVDPTID